MRKEILKAAAARFARYGFQKTTLEEIAADLNKVKSSVYYYFSDKESIFKAVIENELDGFAVMLKKNVDKAVNPKEKLLVFITSHFMIFEKLTKGFSTIKEIYFSKRDIVRKTREKYDEREINMITLILKEGNKTNEFSVKDVKNTALSVLTAIKGVEQEMLTAESLKKVKAVSKNMALILVNGISKEK
ncbi:MAG: TetR/AcrR family transcriptional regulator [Endomicrobium sp.]|jgi:AcrR family transcriptional regulator|nr:TetR/AcrR family transcriptional regulator [Endomicrobium sp.]